ncbi:MAG: hypothetical protein K2I01_05590 [Lachnospiraceae bacterium]|nr:hypothetical protein [Lachnospiraceae bacterium]
MAGVHITINNGCAVASCHFTGIVFGKGKTQNGRKFPARKGIAIALLVLGCLLLLPLGITAYGIAVGTGWENMRKIQAVEAIGNETYVPDDEWKNGVD